MLFHAYEHLGALGTGLNTTTVQVELVRAEAWQKRPSRAAQVQRRGPFLASHLNSTVF
jgi:hypothetical protein